MIPHKFKFTPASRVIHLLVIQYNKIRLVSTRIFIRTSSDQALGNQITNRKLPHPTLQLSARIHCRSTTGALFTSTLPNTAKTALNPTYSTTSPLSIRTSTAVRDVYPQFHTKPCVPLELPCHVWHHTTSHHITSHHIASHHIASHHNTHTCPTSSSSSSSSSGLLPCWLHCTTLYYTAPRYTVLHHTLKRGLEG
jgi:hypothetical protein